MSAPSLGVEPADAARRGSDEAAAKIIAGRQVNPARCAAGVETSARRD